MIWDTAYKYFKMWFWILFGLNIVTKVHGYANGFFPNSCGNMFVDHKGRDGAQFVPQNTKPPFTINCAYSQKGDPVKVTLESPHSPGFRGFMLEAWTSGTDHPVGNFILLESSKTRLLNCRNIPGQAVSQRNNQRKTSIQVNWTAGGQDITDINFRVTFVESLGRFWNVKNYNVTLPSPTTPSPTPLPMTTIKNTTPGTTTETTTSGTTAETTTSGTTTETTASGTTTETTASGTTTETTASGTTAETTMSGTTTETTTSGTTTETATLGTTTETTASGTTTETTASGTTAETTASGTTTETTASGTTTETTASGTTTETTASGTTTETTTSGTTTETATLGTTTETTTSGTTTETTASGPSTTTQSSRNLRLLKGAGTSVMNFRSVLVLLKMELPTILMTMTTLINSFCSHHLNKALKISCCLLCVAIEISALVLFCLAEPIKVTLLVLVCVTIALNFVELVIVCLPIGPSHELKEISDIIVEVCSAIHSMFTIAVIIVSVLDNDSCGKTRKDSWLVKVTIAFTVWMVLFVIWVFIRCILRNTILGGNSKGSLKSSESWRRQRKKKKPSAAEKCFSAASALFFFGAICFAVAVTVGIFRCQEK